jgi:hypothetical protein
MSFITRQGWRPALLLSAAVMLFGTAVSAQDMEKPGVAVFVTGDIPSNERKILGTYLLAAIVKSGYGVSAENTEAFLYFRKSVTGSSRGYWGGWNNHQLMLGLYFANSKRER